MTYQAIATDQPIDAVCVGDFVAFARNGETSPLLRRVVAAKRSKQFRPDLNGWDYLVTVTLAAHPRRHSAKSGVDVVARWSGEFVEVCTEAQS